MGESTLLCDGAVSNEVVEVFNLCDYRHHIQMAAFEVHRIHDVLLTNSVGSIWSDSELELILGLNVYLVYV